MKLFMSVLFSLMSLFSFGQTTANDIIGKWKTSKGDIVTVSIQNGIYTGTAVGKDNKIIDIFQGIKFSKGRYTGKLYAPKKDQTLNCKLKIKSKETLEVIVKKGYFSKTLTWKKIS